MKRSLVAAFLLTLSCLPAFHLRADASDSTFSIFSVSLVDSPLRAQIDVDIVMSAVLPRANVEDAMYAVLLEQRTRQVFTHHGGYATHITVYAFASRDDAEDPSRPWIAKLAWHVEQHPSTEIIFSAEAMASPTAPLPRDAIARIGQARPIGFAFSQDGEHLAVFTSEYTEIRNPVDMTVLRYLPPFPPDGHFLPDGTRLYSIQDDHTIKLLDTATGDKSTYALTHIYEAFNSDAMCPAGRILATGYGDGSIRLWHFPTGQHIRTLEAHAACVSALVFSPNGTSLASIDHDGVLKRWDVSTGRVTHSLTGESITFEQMTLSPDGTKIAYRTGDWRPDPPTLVVWCIETNRRVRVPAWADQGAGTAVGVWRSASLAFSPDGRLLLLDAFARESQVLCFDSETLETVFELTGLEIAGAFAFNHDGSRFLAYSDGALRLLSTTTWEPTAPPVEVTYGSGCIVFSNDGNRITTSDASGDIHLWDIASQTLISTHSGHTDTVNAIAFGPNGTLVASGSGDGTIRIWDSASGDLVRTLNPDSGNVTCVAFSPDGSLLAAGGWSGSTMIWDVASGEVKHALELIGRANAIAWHPSGEAIAVALGLFSSVQILRLSGEGRPLRLGGSQGPLSFSPDGTQLSLGPLDFTPCGRFLVGATFSYPLLLWSTVDGTQSVSAVEPHATTVWNTASASLLFAVESVSDHVSAGVGRWDADTGAYLGQLVELPSTPIAFCIPYAESVLVATTTCLVHRDSLIIFRATVPETNHAP